MTDQDLVHALRSNRIQPSDAYARLYDAYGEELYRECWVSLRDTDMAHTVLRDTFIVARAHIDRLSDSARLREWLIAIARAECARHPVAARASATALAAPTNQMAAPISGEYAEQFTGESPLCHRPPCLRLRVLSGVTGPDLSGYRAHIAERANAFDRCGFPLPPSTKRPDALSSRLVPGLILAACALLILVLVVYVCVRTTPAPMPWPIDPIVTMSG
ncbi:hypothetical protein CDO52_25815 [Nocardiopsis gilva YIM 90087]|uniref:RNA polymerase sigma-70 region 2 domain-containing protein n=1 Tax=Nocardiopsis gilva YIM 90087 TaxID=1235441 RepID=A0A223SC73_9ACTN|nr:hypothetical protein [Nocardiopsis gilva]ASU85764.1 hypothetical protein CDO52_25815 [Nocardiopsis gilva YIM 90087]